MKKIFFLILFILFYSMTTYAGQVSSALDISVNVVEPPPVCTVRTTPYDSPDYTGLEAANGFAIIYVNCPDDLPINIALDAGQNYGLGQYDTLRAVTDGSGNYLSYGIGKPTTVAEAWGDNDFAATVPNASSYFTYGTGFEVYYQAWVNLLAIGEPAQTGTYTDIVNVTVHF